MIHDNTFAISLDDERRINPAKTIELITGNPPKTIISCKMNTSFSTLQAAYYVKNIKINDYGINKSNR